MKTIVFEGLKGQEAPLESPKEGSLLLIPERTPEKLELRIKLGRTNVSLEVDAATAIVVAAGMKAWADDFIRASLEET